MDLTRVELPDVVGDVVNVGAQDVFSLPKFGEEGVAWALRGMQARSPATRRFIAKFQSILDGSQPSVERLAMLSQTSAANFAPSTSHRRTVRKINALHAFFRLMGVSGLVEFCSRYVEPGDAFVENGEDTIFYDIEEKEVAAGAIGAHGIIMRTDMLTHSRYLARLHITHGGETWYRAENAGLYLTVRHPADYTDTLFRGGSAVCRQ